MDNLSEALEEFSSILLLITFVFIFFISLNNKSNFFIIFPF